MSANLVQIILKKKIKKKSPCVEKMYHPSQLGDDCLISSNFLYAH